LKGQKRGFTLVEIIISIGIISIAFYTLISVFGDTTFKNVGSQQLLTAEFLAEQAMEEFTAEGKDWNTDLISREATGFGGEFSDFYNRVNVVCVDLSDLNQPAAVQPTNYKRIEVIVTGEALSVPIKLVTLKVRYNP